MLLNFFPNHIVGKINSSTVSFFFVRESNSSLRDIENIAESWACEKSEASSPKRLAFIGKPSSKSLI